VNNLIGVMQGRLLPKYKGRYQAHPVGYWQKEFPIAKSLGLGCIEFILDFNDLEKNPLIYHGGVTEILQCIEDTGVQVKTICADYFMEAPLHSKDAHIAQKSMEILRQLLDASQTMGVTDVVIPCVDHASLNGREDVERFISVIQGELANIKSKGINLSLETDLASAPFRDLLDRVDSSYVTVNYDIGNSAALGFDPAVELEAYGDRITDIHIKDRVRGGGPVMLGEGDADFDRFFTALKKCDYRGPFVMQAYRDDEGVAIFKEQFMWINTRFLKHSGLTEEVCN